MDKNVFNAAPEPPAGLAERILLRIERERHRRFLMKAWTLALAFTASVSLIVYGSFAAVADASRSGFLVFASLLFSNFSATAASFSDFLFSIAESFPVFPAALLLSGILFAIWSAAKMTNEVVHMRRGAPGRNFSFRTTR